MNVALIVGALQISTWSAAPAPVTVGDTVFVSRQIVVDDGVQIRVQPREGTPELEPLSDPLVSYSEGIATIRYAFAFFDARRHGIPMPDIEMRFPDGRLVQVPGDTAWVTVVSVLPAADSLPPPQPALDPLRRDVRRADPVVFLVVSLLALGTLWGLSRRRSGKRPIWPITDPTAEPVPIETWLGAGEPRAVATVVAAHLREAIERGEPSAGRQLSTGECVEILKGTRPDWPVEELTKTLGLLDQARFAPAGAHDLVDLAEEADRLAQSLRRTELSET